MTSRDTYSVAASDSISRGGKQCSVGGTVMKVTIFFELIGSWIDARDNSMNRLDQITLH
jgi:hypothetical protein